MDGCLACAQIRSGYLVSSFGVKRDSSIRDNLSVFGVNEKGGGWLLISLSFVHCLTCSQPKACN